MSKAAERAITTAAAISSPLSVPLMFAILCAKGEAFDDGERLGTKLAETALIVGLGCTPAVGQACSFVMIDELIKDSREDFGNFDEKK